MTVSLKKKSKTRVCVCMCVFASKHAWVDAPIRVFARVRACNCRLLCAIAKGGSLQRLTCTRDTRILRMIAVGGSQWLRGAVQQVLLCARTLNVVQQDGQGGGPLSEVSLRPCCDVGTETVSAQCPLRLGVSWKDGLVLQISGQDNGQGRIMANTSSVKHVVKLQIKVFFLSDDFSFCMYCYCEVCCPHCC